MRSVFGTDHVAALGNMVEPPATAMAARGVKGLQSLPDQIGDGPAHSRLVDGHMDVRPKAGCPRTRPTSDLVGVAGPKGSRRCGGHEARCHPFKDHKGGEVVRLTDIEVRG